MSLSAVPAGSGLAAGGGGVAESEAATTLQGLSSGGPGRFASIDAMEHGKAMCQKGIEGSGAFGDDPEHRRRLSGCLGFNPPGVGN